MNSGDGDGRFLVRQTEGVRWMLNVPDYHIHSQNKAHLYSQDRLRQILHPLQRILHLRRNNRPEVQAQQMHRLKGPYVPLNAWKERREFHVAHSRRS